ncbi:MAG: DUF3786 domain-containing protein [Syntrophobacterales bacterium]|jgi:hypothetical protein
MNDQYLLIQMEHLKEAWLRGKETLVQTLPARLEGDCFYFQAFGETCELCQDAITLGGMVATGPEGILISLYARQVREEPTKMHPLQSFKELPNSGPYQGAFVARSEQVLVPHVLSIQREKQGIAQHFSGVVNTDAPSGDFSFTLYPLPRIPLYYIFYLPDEEFPAAVTCLFAADAASHLSVDGLADVAEYTGKRIIEMVK